MVTTTSVEASGLIARWLPDVETELGRHIDVVATGSGRALRILERGDAHLALTHDPEGERALVARGWADRHPVMWNHFVIVGPPADPAAIRGGTDAPGALRKIAATSAPFTSRGDDSGTHRAEKRLWRAAGITPAAPWYRETGQGQGVTLRMAHEIQGYMLCDLSTFETYRGRLDLDVLVKGGPDLRNVYSLLVPRRASEEKRAAALVVLAWLRTPTAQAHMRSLRFEPIL